MALQMDSFQTRKYSQRMYPTSVRVNGGNYWDWATGIPLKRSSCDRMCSHYLCPVAGVIGRCTEIATVGQGMVESFCQGFLSHSLVLLVLRHACRSVVPRKSAKVSYWRPGAKEVEKAKLAVWVFPAFKKFGMLLQLDL